MGQHIESYETVSIEDVLVTVNQDNKLSDHDHDRLQAELARLRRIEAKANLFLSEWQGGNGWDVDTCEAAVELGEALTRGVFA